MMPLIATHRRKVLFQQHLGCKECR